MKKINFVEVSNEFTAMKNIALSFGLSNESAVLKAASLIQNNYGVDLRSMFVGEHEECKKEEYKKEECKKEDNRPKRRQYYTYEKKHAMTVSEKEKEDYMTLDDLASMFEVTHVRMQNMLVRIGMHKSNGKRYIPTKQGKNFATTFTRKDDPSISFWEYAWHKSVVEKLNKIAA